MLPAPLPNPFQGYTYSCLLMTKGLCFNNSLHVLVRRFPWQHFYQNLNMVDDIHQSRSDSRTRDSEARKSSELASEHSPMLEEQWPYRRESFPRQCRVLPILNLILLLLQICLLSWHSAIHAPSKTVETVNAIYGSDQTYMTLDHNYDFLWDDRAIKKAGVIFLQTDGQGKEKEYAAITM